MKRLCFATCSAKVIASVRISSIAAATCDAGFRLEEEPTGELVQKNFDVRFRKREGHQYVLKLDGSPMKITISILFIALFALTACSSTDEAASTAASQTPSPQPTATQIIVLPTPSSPGDRIVWENLQVTMDNVEVSQDYLTDYGSTRIPSPGQKFLWVHIRLKNIGQIQLDVPVAEHFSVLYAATELKPTYGHRQGYADYTVLGQIIFPNQELDAWLRFDIPTTAELNNLRFVFLPGSSQVGTSFSSPEYPYAKDKPTYVWNCVP